MLHRRVFLVVALLSFLCPSPGWSLDLAAIPRHIHKQPNYQSAQPKFGLLVFGHNAETRVWVVIDGDVLYLDRNGNGDLTEPGERFDLEVTIFANGVNEFAHADFADSPEEAAIICFIGPKTFKHDLDESPILRRGEANGLTAAIISEGIRSKTVIDCLYVPEEIHPVVEIECPSRFADRPPVKVRAELTHRC